MAGIKDVIIVSNAEYIASFRNLLSNGNHLGIDLNYVEQPKSDGIVGALASTTNLVKDSDALVILGDNVFFGGGFGATLDGLSKNETAKIWVKQVGNAKEYGILSLDSQGLPYSVEEKPKTPKGNLAITGLYYFPKEFVRNLSEVSASARGEYEITSLIERYLRAKKLEVKYLRRGTAWFDAGTSERLFMTSDFVRIIQDRTGQIVGSPEETSFRQGNISRDELKFLIQLMPNSTYKVMLTEMMEF